MSAAARDVAGTVTGWSYDDDGDVVSVQFTTADGKNGTASIDKKLGEKIREDVNAGHSVGVKTTKLEGGTVTSASTRVRKR